MRSIFKIIVLFKKIDLKFEKYTSKNPKIEKF